MFQLGRTIFNHDKVKIVKLSLQQTGADTGIAQGATIKMGQKFLKAVKYSTQAGKNVLPVAL